MRMESLRVAVIGAGAAGLVALRHLNNGLAGTKNSRISAVAFEQAPQLGGTWFYTEQIGTDEYGQPIHSSMYKNLRTNLPKECMAFPDFAFPEDLPSFVGHQVVQKYLEDYATYYKLWDAIQFNRKVQLVQPVHNDGSNLPLWKVTTNNVRSLDDQEVTDTFDAVVICNGHYALPLYPVVPGADTFKGRTLHSHNYREPDKYRDQTVVLLGANSSGQDIAIELAQVAKKVIISHNKAPLTSVLPENVSQCPGIAHIYNHSIIFTDETSVNADTLIYCTGYHYDYSFLSPDVGIQVEDGRVTPLYKHFLHSKYPNLGIIGICKLIIPFPMFDVQAQFFRSMLAKEFILPSEEEMNLDTENDYKNRRAQGMAHRHAHVMGNKQFEYNESLAKLAPIRPVPACVQKLYEQVHEMRRWDIIGYKNINYQLSDKNGEIVIEQS